MDVASYNAEATKTFVPSFPSFYEALDTPMRPFSFSHQVTQCCEYHGKGSKAFAGLAICFYLNKYRPLARVYPHVTASFNPLTPEFFPRRFMRRIEGVR